MLIIESSKQNIINIGFPPVIATQFFRLFGQDNAFTIARWYKEYNNISGSDNKTWWKRTHWSKTASQDINLLVELVTAIQVSLEEYNRVRKDNGLREIKPEEFNPKQEIDLLVETTESLLLENLLFDSNLLKAIMSGKIKDIGPYKNLSFQEANDKYETKTIFDDKQPIKIYRNGWKWIDVGRKCNLVGRLMKNCGSVGAIASDPKATMLVLFDTNNIPHAMVMYSPGENRVSSVEGQGSTGIKQEYSKYVTDLIKKLKANYDITRGNNNPVLQLHYELNGIIKNLKLFFKQTTIEGGTEFFTFKTLDGKQWFASQYFVVEKQPVLIVANKLKTTIPLLLKDLSDYWSKEKLLSENPELKVYNLFQFKKLYTPVKTESRKLVFSSLIFSS